MKKFSPKIIFWLVFSFTQIWNSSSCDAQSAGKHQIDLAGKWAFAIDSLDKGVSQQWYRQKLKGSITLPGSMTTNGKGNDITLQTPWTGQIVDSSYFHKSEYAPYRQPGNIKVPFWLQPVKYYKGAAWYQNEVEIPKSWKGRHQELFLERSHWETTVWVDNQQIGMQNSLGTPHIFNLTKVLTPGKHTITVRIDNRVKDFNVGQNSHSISDHTQSNWNGLVGKLLLTSQPAAHIAEVQLFPDVKNKQVLAKVKIASTTGGAGKGELRLLATSANQKAEKLAAVVQKVNLSKDTTSLTITYAMGENPMLWDEFNPNLYSLQVSFKSKGGTDEKDITFGMREVSTQGTHITINGRPTFLRGTLESAIFPKTGYPPTNVAEWERIYRAAKSFGLNHIRFHSWCPPEAAFEAADRVGIYLQIENSSWANQGATIGDGGAIDKYIYTESERVVRAYGNHPSFCMMAYGNEPGGKKYIEYLTGFVNYWKAKDNRRLYTSAAGWPAIPENDFQNLPEPRIQAWGAGLKSIINAQAPSTDYDWSKIIAQWPQPTISHEIGQWCVYPNFKEIPKYDGVLKPKNFEIFQDKLRDNGMASLADSFLLASGKLQTLCYKADIEAALRTPGFGGFQLLDLHDFPGQGTALVGVLDPFWDEKGYVTAAEYSKFCNVTVPLARLPKMVYLNNEELIAPIDIAHFGEAALQNAAPTWTITNEAGATLFRGELAKKDIPLGNNFRLGEIKQSLQSVDQPRNLKLNVKVGNFENSWSFFVYPASLPAFPDKDILVTQQLDEKALKALQKGGKVLLTFKKGTVRPSKGGDVQIGFSSIFWNTAWTGGQAPNTLGILCNPQHPGLEMFPTSYHSDWQWWDAMSHSDAILLDSVSAGLQPIVRVIDDWVTARPLGLVFECRVGNGKLLVSGIDLLSDQEKRPEARQLLYSLKHYMAGNKFQPKHTVAPNKITSLASKSLSMQQQRE